MVEELELADAPDEDGEAATSGSEPSPLTPPKTPSLPPPVPTGRGARAAAPEAKKGTSPPPAFPSTPAAGVKTPSSLPPAVTAPKAAAGERAPGAAGEPVTDVAAIKRITQQLEALDPKGLKPPAIDPRTAAVSALMVANHVGDGPIRARFDALVRAGLLDEHAVADLPVLARFVLRVLPKLGPDLVELTHVAPEDLERVCRAHREDLLDLAERHLDEIDEAHGRIATVRHGSTAADVVLDLRLLADLCHDYADVLARDKAAFTPALATRARELADRLEEAVLGTEPEETREWRVYLLRAWSQLVKTYEEVCRAGRFLLPEDKPEARFPNLASVMRVRRRTRNEGGNFGDSQIDPAAARRATRGAAAQRSAGGDRAMPPAPPRPPAAEGANVSPAAPASPPLTTTTSATVASTAAPTAMGVPPPAVTATASPAVLAAAVPPPPVVTSAPAHHGHGRPHRTTTPSIPELDLVEAGPARTSRDEAEIVALMAKQRAPLASIDIDASALTDAAAAAEVHDAVREEDERGRRVPVALDVTFASDSNFYSGLGDGDVGLFMATYVVKPPGTRLEISLGLPGIAEPLEILGVVRWVREFSPAIEAAPGMGIALEYLTDGDREAIHRFLANRPPMFFDE